MPTQLQEFVDVATSIDMAHLNAAVLAQSTLVTGTLPTSVSGLTFTPGALSLVINTGAQSIFLAVTPAGIAIAGGANSLNYVWISTAGVLSQNLTGTPPANTTLLCTCLVNGANNAMTVAQWLSNYPLSIDMVAGDTAEAATADPLTSTISLHNSLNRIEHAIAVLYGGSFAGAVANTKAAILADGTNGSANQTISGTLTAGALIVTGALTAGSLSVSGNSNLSSTTTVNNLVINGVMSGPGVAALNLHGGTPTFGAPTYTPQGWPSAGSGNSFSNAVLTAGSTDNATLFTFDCSVSSTTSGTPGGTSGTVLVMGKFTATGIITFARAYNTPPTMAYSVLGPRSKLINNQGGGQNINFSVSNITTTGFTWTVVGDTGQAPIGTTLSAGGTGLQAVFVVTP